MRIGVVVDPAPGRGRRGGFWLAVQAVLQRRGAILDIRRTTEEEDAAHLGRLFSDDGADLVLAVGGDATVSDVAGGVLRSGRPATAFSFVPAASRSDFARNFALPETPAAYAERLLDAPLRALDAGLMTCDRQGGPPATRHFVNIASFGLPGALSQAAGRGRQQRWLPYAPVLLPAVEFLRHKPCRVRLRLDGFAHYEGPVTAVAVSNGRWFSAGRQIAPDAGLSDGFFDVVIIRGAPGLSALRVMNGIRSGAHLHHSLVSVHRARRIEVWPAGRRSAGMALIESDGRVVGQVPARFDMLPGALNLKI